MSTYLSRLEEVEKKLQLEIVPNKCTECKAAERIKYLEDWIETQFGENPVPIHLRRKAKNV